MTDKERYATIGTWAEVLSEEGDPVGTKTIKARLSEAGIIGETGRDRVGRILFKGYYREVDVREACRDLLAEYPQVDEHGFVEIDGERHATVGFWADYYNSREGVNVSEASIYKNLKAAGIVGKTARNRQHRILDNLFYGESDVRAVCGDLIKSLPIAEEDGTLFIDGVPFGTIAGLARKYQVGQRKLSEALKSFGVPLVKGKLAIGQVRLFYSEEIVSRLFARLPRADADGFIVVDGKRYATVHKYAEFFGIPLKLICKRVEDGACDSITGKIAKGDEKPFYLESSVRELCKDYLRELPRADEQGVFVLEGRTYGATKAICSRLGIGKDRLHSLFNKFQIQPIEGKRSDGWIVSFYFLEEVQAAYEATGGKQKRSPVVTRRLTSEEIASLPEADDEGVIQKDAESYCNIVRMAQLLDLSSSSISCRIRKSNLVPLMGRLKSGQVGKFYRISSVRELFSDVETGLPEADADGVITLDGFRYANIRGLSDKTGLSPLTISRKIKTSLISSIRGTLINGHAYDFYNEDEVCTLFKEMLSLPIADDQGFIELEGQRFGTIHAFSNLFNVSNTPLVARVKQTGVKSIRGRGRGGHIHTFYHEDELRELYLDIPLADEFGFIEVGGERYGTITSLVKSLQIPRQAIQEAIEEVSLKPAEGRAASGSIYRFYSESRIRELCEDQHIDAPNADEDGFIVLDGVRYGTLNRLAIVYEVGHDASLRVIKKSVLRPIKGRAATGNLRDYYSEVSFRELCLDLLMTPSAGDDGFLLIDGFRYGTIPLLAGICDLNTDTVRARLNKPGVSFVKGRPRTGNIVKYYSETDFEEICADLIAKKSKKE